MHFMGGEERKQRGSAFCLPPERWKYVLFPSSEDLTAQYSSPDVLMYN